jgi:DNA/RNA-binding domain of Phe-tRNA-synthetase-like protein
MFFRHSSAIWQQFPQLVPGVLQVEGIEATADVQGLVEPLHARARERLAAGPESELAEISAWRRAFTQMGLKPTQYRCAAEALLRRFRRDGALPGLHPLVDFCNALSLAFAVPVAVFDLDAVDSCLEVRHADGGEEHWGFGGEVEHPEPGEVIFVDAANHAHARRWTFRQSRKSTVGPETRRVLIVAEGLHPAAASDVPALLAALGAGITSRWSAPRRTAVLTATTPQVELPS